MFRRKKEVSRGHFTSPRSFRRDREPSRPQFHAPAAPYAVKIALGLVELTALGLYLGLGGRGD